MSVNTAAAPPARGSRLFALGIVTYAALLLVARLSGRTWLDELAAFALVGVFLLPGLRHGSARAWTAWLVTAALLVLLGVRGNGHFALDALPVAVNAALCIVFARTLARGREPLIARIIGVLEGRSRLDLPRVAAYARALTWAWTLLFGAQVALLGALVLFVQPDGALAALGIASPLAVDGAAWRGYRQWGSLALVPAFLIAEYLFRRHWLRHLPHMSLPLFIGRLMRRWPALARSFADAEPDANRAAAMARLHGGPRDVD